MTWRRVRTPGDVAPFSELEIEMTGVGTLRNKIAAERRGNN